MWVGMYWSATNWKWTNGHTVPYYNWKRGEPNNWEGGGEVSFNKKVMSPLVNRPEFS